MKRNNNIFYKILRELDLSFTFLFLRLLDLLSSGLIFSRLRADILRFIGFKIGKNVQIKPGIIIRRKSDELSIGENTSINYNVLFDTTSAVKIGKYCQIAYNVTFSTSSHTIKSDFKTRRQDIFNLPIIVEDFVWIGCNSVILGGLTIGKGSVIAAGSIVTKNVPPNVVVAGIPAKVIKQID